MRAVLAKFKARRPGRLARRVEAVASAAVQAVRTQAAAGPLAKIDVERIAGRDVVVIASAADPRICNLIMPGAPHYAALRVRAEARP